MSRRRLPPSDARTTKANNILADIVLRTPYIPAHNHRPTADEHAPPAEKSTSRYATLLTSLVDFSFILSLVFGGCCANVWAYEYLLNIDSRIGTALTFSQMTFITLHSLPSFLHLTYLSVPLPIAFPKHIPIPIPHLKSRQVPLSQWALQVCVLTTGSLLNNWAFAFSVPLTVQIVFRSAGLAVSMLFGRLFLNKRYSYPQIASVLLVTFGVILATTSRPSSPPPSSGTTPDPVDYTEYSLGILMLSLSLLLSGVLGMLQERTYTTYGPCWREGVFYTGRNTTKATLVFGTLRGLSPYLTLLANLATQLVCVSGVNQLTSRVSSVSTNLVLTTRKALSLLFSVWWFGNGWNDQLGLGAGFVFAGSIIYTTVASASSNSTSTKPSSAENPARLNSPGNVKTESPTPARTIHIKREDSIRIPFTPPQPNQKANWKEEDTDDDDNTNTNGPGGHNMLTRRRVHKMEFAETELDLDDGLRERRGGGSRGRCREGTSKGQRTRTGQIEGESKGQRASLVSFITARE
ncbi:hypothetical protein EW026_g222 [Hermanssonia centrifuga]|uniref:UAA transporter n=1 Tax=Hermanssonia centrifuga TaxID=98765 RepID=A0A4S4KX13_9APHY|nr:hypothetical protein EW026_g222 [Hermanssonia centrifuga]